MEPSSSAPTPQPSNEETPKVVDATVSPDATESAPASPEPAAEPVPAPQPPAAPVVASTAAPVVAPMATVVSSGGDSRFSRRKKLIFGIGVVVAILALISGVVFGYYVPNKPENVWKTGINHTGRAVDGVIQDGTDKDRLSALAKSQVSGKFDLNAGDDGTFSGTIDSWQTSSDSDSTVDVHFKAGDQVDRELKARLLTEIAKGKQYPDIYLQVTGLQALQLDAFLPGISDYEGKWLTVSGDYLKTLADSSGASSDNTSSVTAADGAALARSLSATTKQYVFSSDPKVAVLENRKFDGKETVDGVKTNRYTIGLNKANTKKYCAALGDTLADSAAYKKLVDAKDRSDRKKDFVDDCQKGADDIKPSDTFDAWVGGKYRLIQKVRFSDDNDKSSYADIGEHYSGGDTFQLYLNMHDSDEKADLHMTFDTNTKTSVSKLNFTYDQNQADNKLKASGDLNFKPYTGKSTITRPSNATNLQDLISQFESAYTLPTDSTDTGTDLQLN